MYAFEQSEKGMDFNMKKISKKINTYQLFTITFIILCFGVFFSFIKSGRSFIWEPDGFKQHYVFLEQFYETIKNAKSGISTFSWNLGLGLDQVGQLTYYCLGDPFAILSLLFPIKYLKYVYSALVILRIYFVGISFIAYCNYHKKSRFATLIGALIYTFSGYILFAAVRHPFFANAAIWLPLMFLGIDKILKEDKYKLFTFVSAISAVSNYYFLYMITILTFIYAVIKYWTEYKENGMKTFWAKFFKTVLCYLIGILSASILLLPTIYAFLNNSRVGTTSFTRYTLGYYAKLIFLSAQTPFWAKVSVCPLAIVLLPVAVLNYKKNKENRTWLKNLLVYFVILLIPFLGSVMNGFSFQSNRWTFGFSFALSYLVVINLRNSLTYSHKEFKLIKNCLIIYFLLWFLLKSLAGFFPAFSIASAFVFLVILASRSFDYPKIKKDLYFQFADDLKSEESKKIAQRVKKILLLAVCGYILIYSWEAYTHGNYYKEFIKFSEVQSNYDTIGNNIKHYAEAINYIKQHYDGIYRIGNNISDSNNISYKYNYNGLNNYLSIGNKYLTELSRELLILNSAKTNPLREFDSRPRITTMLGAKYYVVSKKDASYVPYGYNLIYEIKDEKNDKNTAQIYQNQYALPFAIFYNNYILKKDYEPLSPIEKEHALLKTAVIDDSGILNGTNVIQNRKITDDISSIKDDNTSKEESISSIKEDNTSKKESISSFKEVKYEIKDSLEIIDENAKIITPKKNKNSFKLKIKDKDINNCELYLLIEGQKYSTHAEQSITVKYNGIKKKQLIRDKVTSPYYIDNPNILFNLGYRENHSGNISIVFSVKKGMYSYKDIKLIAVPVDDYEADINNLKKYEFNITSFSDKNMSGTISNYEDGILQLSTSYSEGWTAYVDGNKTEIINVNTGFIGIPLAKGDHKVEFVYETPYLELGAKLSCVGLLLIVLVFIIDIIRHRKKT